MILRSFSRKLKTFLRKITSNEKGAALVVSLLVLMVLVLLGLTLILQSQTEYLGAVNETDSLAALSFAESGLEWALREIKDKASADLDIVLRGPNDVDNGNSVDDNLIGIRDNLSTTLTSLTQLNSTCPSANCEQTESVNLTIDWDNDGTSERYEAFRTGTDTNGDGVWDGPRAHLYIRVDDNYDDPANSGIQDRDDNDLRGRVRVMSEYPIFVDSNGQSVDPVLATRGIAIRKLEGRLAPLDNVAVVVNKLLDAEGNHRVCGACGSIHSNGDMNFSGGTGDICQDATASGNYDTSGGSGGPNVGGESGPGYDQRPVPVINPYDEVFVPSTATFDHSADSELSLTTTAVGTALQCSPPTALDPGSSKYFAFVVGLNNVFRVYKGYPDFAAGANRWLWRLIDEGPTLTAVIDNCGRVVSNADPALGADVCSIGAPGCPAGSATYGVSDVVDCCGAPYPVDGIIYDHANCIDPVDGVTNRCVPDGVIDSTYDDPTSGDSHFYGFSPGANYDPETCAEEDSLTGISNNDFTTNNFLLYPSGQNSDANFLPLPGGAPDGQADWNYTFWNRFNRWKWNASASTIFSPMQNAVVFVVGNLTINGAMTNDTLQFYDPDPTSPSLPGTYSITNPLTHWRISPITYGRVEIQDSWIAPANSAGPCLNNPINACNLGAVSGRDIELKGGGGSGCVGMDDCNLCPDLVTDSSLDCETPLAVVPVGFAGYFMAHEQVSMRGNSRINGFVIAEEASYCAEWTGQQQESNIGNGNPSIYYDCNSPPNPFQTDLLQITSWEEVQ